MNDYQTCNNYLKNKIIGQILIILGFLIFVIFTIWIILAKLINTDEIIKNLNGNSEFIKSILNFFKNDRIYCLFLPILFPILVIVSYSRWTAFNYFRYCD
jgi:hypothetical protein